MFSFEKNKITRHIIFYGNIAFDVHSSNNTTGNYLKYDLFFTH